MVVTFVVGQVVHRKKTTNCEVNLSLRLLCVNFL